MSVLCGNCRDHHASAADVRACYATGRQTSISAGQSATARTPVAEPGMYSLGGEVFKVQRAVHGSGHLYAKRLVHGKLGERDRFEYAPGAIRDLTTEDRLTLEQAREYGALYGTCCVCGALLTNEDSIEAGIGPICAGRL